MKNCMACMARDFNYPADKTALIVLGGHLSGRHTLEETRDNLCDKHRAALKAGEANVASLIDALRGK